MYEIRMSGDAFACFSRMLYLAEREENTKEYIQSSEFIEMLYVKYHNTDRFVEDIFVALEAYVIGKFAEIKHIDMYGVPYDGDLDYISAFDTVDTVYLANTDITLMPYWITLQTINILSCNIEPDVDFPDVDAYYIGNCSLPEDFLASFNNVRLRELSLVGMDAVNDLSPLIDVPSLEYLTLKNCQHAAGCDQLIQLKRLTVEITDHEYIEIQKQRDILEAMKKVIDVLKDHNLKFAEITIRDEIYRYGEEEDSQ
jgi:hypothetical protein